MITASIALDLRTSPVGPELQSYLDCIRSVVPVEHADVRRDIGVRELSALICDGTFD